MSSDASPPREAFVRIWLPGGTDPVVAGRIQPESGRYLFNYGRSYLAREDAIPIHLPELPLRPGAIAPEPPLEIANALRDASPDAWGRRVIISRFAVARGKSADVVDLDELTFLLHSGSDRIGAFDFQSSPSEYVPRENDNTLLGQLLMASERVDQGLPQPMALRGVDSAGVARPQNAVYTPWSVPGAGPPLRTQGQPQSRRSGNRPTPLRPNAVRPSRKLLRRTLLAVRIPSTW